MGQYGHISLVFIHKSDKAFLSIYIAHTKHLSLQKINWCGSYRADIGVVQYLLLLNKFFENVKFKHLA